MIGRGTTLRLADAAQARFSATNGPASRGRYVPWDPVYDFCFGWDFEPLFCNAIKYAASQGERAFSEFILRLHTGETVLVLRARAVESPEMEGQVFLRQLAQAILADYHQPPVAGTVPGGNTSRALAEAGKRLLKPSMNALIAALELDGYAWANEKLIHRESAPVDAEKHRSLLVMQASDLGLSKLDVLAHNLKLSEDAYQASRWEDCVGNARKAMELAFQECAALWSRKILGQELDPETYKWPAEVRNFMEAQGLLTEHERKAAAANYGMFSGVGNHPYIAQNDQARMGRQIALILAEFVLLRTAAALNEKAK
jgi:hypothetical protein